MFNAIDNFESFVNTSFNLTTDDFEGAYLSPRNFSYPYPRSDSHTKRDGLKIVQVNGTVGSHSRSSSCSSTASYASLDEGLSYQPTLSPEQASSITSYSPSLASPTMSGSSSSLYPSSISSRSNCKPVEPDVRVLAQSGGFSGHSYDVAAIKRPRSIVSSPWTCLESAHHPLCGGVCDAAPGSLQKIMRAPSGVIKPASPRKRSLNRMRSLSRLRSVISMRRLDAHSHGLYFA